ncbi:LysR family transcriptional activator of nhaA [Marinobacterium halophilum]|uniref:LysR family transcriptional activator of nhaA n=1 Tax=Marinobacterium halophilum TaxID=267374 RepID=A0A2P8F4P7_9GAMM|nr:LysR family transcriptional regulator [Marinobacterium halophilum]PSL16683.1 LysR family transcriptional activator of nhaA [Marinobacterium halophilum]
MLNRLNFRHLYHFWVVAREGTMARASQVLELAPQTLSSQVSALESEVGGLLFRREGRGLKLTDLGRTVQRHADAIFEAAEALQQVLQTPAEDRPLNLSVGISASIHKLIAWRLIEPALQLDRELNLSCETGRTPNLLNDLKRRDLDLILTDRPPALEPDSRLYLHDLGSSPMSLFAAPVLAEALREDFPHSLNGQPFLANAVDAPYVSQLMQWFDGAGVEVSIRAQVDDSALIKVFGHHGMGVFAAPGVIADEVCRQYQVEVIGQVESVRDQLYAITRGAHPQHAAVQAICQGRVDDSSKKADDKD